MFLRIHVVNIVTTLRDIRFCAKALGILGSEGGNAAAHAIESPCDSHTRPDWIDKDAVPSFQHEKVIQRLRSELGRLSRTEVCGKLDIIYDAEAAWLYFATLA